MKYTGGNERLPLTASHLDFCETDLQRRKVQAFLDTGSIRKAADSMGISFNAMRQGLHIILRRAAAQNVPVQNQDINEPVPRPFMLRGTSTLYDGDGKPRLTWVKTRLDHLDHEEAMKEGVRAFLEDTPQLPVPDGPLDADDDIIPWINIGDAHFGMLAHEAETGENFDLKIAERELLTAITMAIDELLPVKRLVIQDMGDFTHYENWSGTTEASGHALDFDGRFPKMIRVYSRTFRAIIDKALTKAQVVDVIINQGNHSRVNDIWMAEMIRVAYGHTGRVNVLNNDSVFIGYRMGNTFVMTHHSDKCRPDKLASVMATDFPRDWGETTFRYIDIGHIHHRMVSKEHPGVTIESFNQLAAQDKWAHDGGWRARKCLTIVLRSRTYGEVGRRTIPVEQVRERIFSAMPAGAIYRPEAKAAFVA